MELPDSYHLLQISDLDTHTNEQAFIAALSVPKKEDNRVEATTIDGDRVAVDLTDMSISVNGTLRPHPPKMLHDCQWMQSEYGSGRITIQTKSGSVTFDSAEICPPPYPMPPLTNGAFRWGNPTSEGSTTKVNHTRALAARRQTQTRHSNPSRSSSPPPPMHRSDSPSTPAAALKTAPTPTLPPNSSTTSA